VEENLRDKRTILWLAVYLALWDSLKLLRDIRTRFSRPEDALSAPAGELRALGFDEDRIGRFRPPASIEAADKEFDRAKKKGYSLLTFEDGEYPLFLREIFDPPCVLYYRGRPEALRGPAVALVGTRRPTPYGKAVAERLAEDLASRGIVIVSGMALGIDACAHGGALRGGRTVAVLGSGLDVTYPRHNRRLAEAIAAKGTVVSEFPLGTEPYQANFPRRNRIIAGLAQAVVVVEAAEQSGSLITAQLALDEGREVAAVPGNVTSEVSRGTHKLLRQGAKLVESWVDVAEELAPALRDELLARGPGAPGRLPLPTADEAGVLDRLRIDETTNVDALVEATGRPVTEVLTLLLGLEVKGLVVAGPGPYFRRRM
jgi:DNA processing protein